MKHNKISALITFLSLIALIGCGTTNFTKLSKSVEVEKTIGATIFFKNIIENSTDYKIKISVDELGADPNAMPLSTSYYEASFTEALVNTGMYVVLKSDTYYKFVGEIININDLKVYYNATVGPQIFSNNSNILMYFNAIQIPMVPAGGEGVNYAPVIGPVFYTDINSNNNLLRTITVNASDPESDFLVCTFTSTSNGVSLSNNNGGCTVIATISSVGDYLLTINVSDGVNNVVKIEQFTISVIQAIINKPPDLTLISPVSPSSFPKNSIATFEFSLLDPMLILCAGKDITVVDSISQQSQTVKLLDPCKLSLTLPAVAATFVYTFIYYDEGGLYDSVQATITTTTY